MTRPAPETMTPEDLAEVSPTLAIYFVKIGKYGAALVCAAESEDAARDAAMRQAVEDAMVDEDVYGELPDDADPEDVEGKAAYDAEIAAYRAALKVEEWGIYTGGEEWQITPSNPTIELLRMCEV